MPRLTKTETRKKMRDAVVAEVIESGFGAISVGGVVKRAKVSAGTVYVHFENKDDMLQKVFLEIKSEFHDIMMQAREEETAPGMIRRMWFDMFAFVSAHPSDFLFLEYGNSAHILTEAQEADAARMSSEIAEMLLMGVQDGTLADLDASIISLLLVSPASQLARSAVLTGVEIDPKIVELVFERVWLSIAAAGVAAPKP